MPEKPLRVATANVNGVRAAFRRGMGEWLAARDVDILALQEVRASTDDLQALLGDEWDVVHDPATAKGRAGVALASRRKAHLHRVELGAADFDTAGRWLEADYEVGDRIVTVVSAYVHSGEADTQKEVDFAILLGGSAILTETVFAIPGLGRLAVQGALSLDVALTAGVTLVAALLIVVANIIVDLVYAFVDPRIRLA